MSTSRGAKLPEEIVHDGAMITSTAAKLVRRLREMGQHLTTAESCTGGLIASSITDVPGASAVFDRGVVTYSNAAKTALLGVPEALLVEHGAVSAPVATEMVRGALSAAGADLAIAVSGIAGPGGGSAEKPVGTVFIGVCDREITRVYHFAFANRTRSEFKAVTCAAALRQAAALISDSLPSRGASSLQSDVAAATADGSLQACYQLRADQGVEELALYYRH